MGFGVSGSAIFLPPSYQNGSKADAGRAHPDLLQSLLDPLNPKREFPQIRGVLFWGPYNNEDPLLFGALYWGPLFSETPIEPYLADPAKLRFEPPLRSYHAPLALT